MKIITCENVSPRRRTMFDIPLTLVGTDSQKRVWNALGGVPYGETRAYAVSIFVPCNRVVGSAYCIFHQKLREY